MEKGKELGHGKWQSHSDCRSHVAALRNAQLLISTSDAKLENVAVVSIFHF